MKQLLTLLCAVAISLPLNAQDFQKGLILKYDFNKSAVDSVSGKDIELTGTHYAKDFCETEGKSLEFRIEGQFARQSISDEAFKGHSGLTFSTWVYYKKDKAGNPYFIGGQWNKKNIERRFSMMLDEEHHIIFRVNDGKTWEKGVRSDKKLYDEVWYHVVGVYHKDERYQIFINGELHGMGLQTGSGINPSTSQPFVLGNQLKGDSTSLIYRGRLDKVRLYNRALSLHEIQQLYHLEKSSECITLYTVHGNIKDLLTNDKVGANIHLNHVGKKENHPFSFNWDGTFKFKTEKNASYSIKLLAENYFEYTDTIGPFTQDSWINLKMKPIELERVFTIKNLRFKRGSAQVLPSSYPSLDKLVQMMIENESMEIELRGHTDNIGDSALNQVLSEERVDEVKKYLVDKGIAEKRISGKGFGGSKPIASNNMEHTRRLNRRVEFVVTKY